MISIFITGRITPTSNEIYAVIYFNREYKLRKPYPPFGSDFQPEP